MSTADFSISGDPSTNHGYDADNSEVLDLRLEASPALDIRTIQYSTVVASSDAPALVYSDSGAPSPPTSSCTATMPASGLHAYLIQAQANGGVDAEGNVNSDYTKQRLVVIRATTGVRKLVASERTEYDATHGWVAAINELIDRCKVTHNVETLSGDKTLSSASERYQKLNPGGSHRNVDFPAEDTVEGYQFYIENTGGAADNLVVRNDAAGTIVTLTNQEAAWIVCDGTNLVATGIITVT